MGLTALILNPLPRINNLEEVLHVEGRIGERGASSPCASPELLVERFQCLPARDGPGLLASTADALLQLRYAPNAETSLRSAISCVSSRHSLVLETRH
jgi:hypothetical protein